MSYTICSRFKGEHIVYAGYTICTSREHIVYGAFCGSTLLYLRLLFYRCIVTVNVLWLFLMVSWVGLLCMIVVFPDHNHLLFGVFFCVLTEAQVYLGIQVGTTIGQFLAY